MTISRAAKDRKRDKKKESLKQCFCVECYRKVKKRIAGRCIDCDDAYKRMLNRIAERDAIYNTHLRRHRGV